MSKALKCTIRNILFTAAFVGFSAQATAQLTPAQQQAIDSQTGISSPGRAEETLFEEEFIPRVTPRVNVQKLQIQGAPPGAENIKFELGGIRMEGATVYSARELRSVYASQIGSTITLADLYVIAADLTRKYRNDGYILTQVVVPPQTIEGGIASLKVIEGAINNIEVRGPDSPDIQLVRDYASLIKVSGPLNTSDLERALLLINDIAGVDSRAVLNPSPDTVGAADLLIIIERNPFDMQIGIDNHGTRYLGPLQLSAAGSLNSWFRNNERITAQFVTAPDKDTFHELMYGAIIYEQPLWKHGTELEIIGSYTATDPGHDLAPFGVNGWSASLSTQLEHPFVRSRALNVSGHAKFDYREVTTKNNIPVDPTRRDHIRSFRFGGTVETIDNWMGVAYNLMQVEFSRGLDVLGSNRAGQVDMSRPGADPTFFKMNAEIQRLQWLANNVNLLMAVKGQWSNNALLSSEEFGVGGMEYGRGFDPSEVIGDDGIAGKMELQVTEPWNLALLETYQLYGFMDAGRIWNQDATTRANKKETLKSAGLGIRADFNALTTAGLMVAWPLNNTPQTMGDRDPRLYVNLNRRF